MSKEVLLILGLFQGLAQLAALILGLYGLFLIIVGKFRLGSVRAKGKSARVVGVYFLGQLIAGFFVGSILHEALDWGYSRNAVQASIGAGLTFLIFSILGLVLGLKHAKKDTSQEPD